jgi:ATP-dependent DNA helicase RecG
MQLTAVKGVGPALSQKLAGLNLTTVVDLLHYFPRKYEDYSQIETIAKIKPGVVTIKAVIKQAKGRYVRRGLHLTEAVASDETGSVRLVWFNQPYRAQAFKSGESYFISGQFELSHQRMAIMNPSCELVSSFPVNTARIVPVYRESNGLTSLQIRKIIRQCLPEVRRSQETLPTWLVKRYKLMPYTAALESIHFPKTSDDLHAAQKRLGFEEVFELSLAALFNKQINSHQKALAITFNKQLAQSFVKVLPFTLTDDQRQVIWQIYQDLGRQLPMNRLVEGDVGSGKTVVAIMAALMVMEQGWQVAFMAPTELLARQHAETMYQLLKPMGYGDQVGLLIGGLKSQAKAAMYQNIKSGAVRLIVGTHALIQDKVDMHKLGLVIVDEQHRFGVKQRTALQAKAGHALHVLHMTATPIPRSLALTLYGELDISVISHKPANRLPVITRIVSPNSRKTLYEKIDVELAAGRQAFVVCPLVNESESLNTKAAEKVFEQLSKGFFKHRRIGLLHGQMKAAAKQTIMEQFIKHNLDMLVTTTVIEVGVDVSDATVMLVEDAERYGLAQLHQLRGRIGRSHHQGYCYLMMSDSKAPNARLRALESTNDGFKLAELDLRLRGPGAIYGTLQHGQLDLRVAKLTDSKLIAAARQAAQLFIDKNENLLNYKHLAKRISTLQAVTNLN